MLWRKLSLQSDLLGDCLFGNSSLALMEVESGDVLEQTARRSGLMVVKGLSENGSDACGRIPRLEDILRHLRGVNLGVAGCRLEGEHRWSNGDTTTLLKASDTTANAPQIP